MVFGIRREVLRDMDDTVCLHAVAEESGDAVVPDNMPDIIRIVETDDHVDVKSSDLRGTRLYTDAVAHISAVYVPETGGGLCRLEVTLPLSAVFDFSSTEDIENADFRVRAKLVNVSARELNPRKIAVKVVCDFRCTLCRRRDVEISTGLETGTAELRMATARIRLTGGMCEKTILVSDSAELPAVAADTEEILCYRVRPQLNDTKVIHGKVICKGDLAISLLACGDSEMKPVRSLDAVIPFAGVIDCDGAEDGMEAEIRLHPADCELRIVMENGTNRPLLAAKLDLIAAVSVWEERELDYIADAYCLSAGTQCETEELCFRTVGRCREFRQPHRETIGCSVPVRGVYLCKVTPGPAQYASGEAGTGCACAAEIRLLVESENGGVYSVTRTADIFVPTDLPEGMPVTIEVEDLTFRASGDEEAEVRFTLTVRADGAMTTSIRQVCAMEASKTTEEMGRAPAFTLCHALRGESFWDLGKRMRAAEADIRAVNDLTCDEPPMGQMLLIPRRSLREIRR